MTHRRRVRAAKERLPAPATRRRRLALPWVRGLRLGPGKSGGFVRRMAPWTRAAVGMLWRLRKRRGGGDENTRLAPARTLPPRAP